MKVTGSLSAEYWSIRPMKVRVMLGPCTNLRSNAKIHGLENSDFAISESKSDGVSISF